LITIYASTKMTIQSNPGNLISHSFMLPDTKH
jgi:hypothetical protein